MAQTFTLTMQARSITGNDVRKMRREGKIPAILYGNGHSDILVQCDYNEFVRLYREAGRTNVITIEVDGKHYPCMVHDIDVDPVHGSARHIDLLVVNLKQKITVAVPVELVGEAPAVVQGFLINTALNEVDVEALPNNVPEKIEVDISKLETLQDSVQVKDLPQSDAYDIITDPELSVVSVVAPDVEEAPEAVPTEATAEDAAKEAQPVEGEEKKAN